MVGGGGGVYGALRVQCIKALQCIEGAVHIEGTMH